MKALFVETEAFTDWATGRLSDELLATLQAELMQNPDAGDVMPGCGGLRKIRLPDPVRGKGKRSGIRVIYLHVPAVKRFFLIAAFDKNEKDDLSASDKKAFRQLAEAIRREATRH